MGNLANTIPFTELYERALSIARIDSPNNEDFAKGLINDEYTRVIPRIEDWQPIVSDGNIVTVPVYKTGTVSVDAGDDDVTGVGTVWTAAMIASDGYKIKFTGNDNIYGFTYASATTATITPALSGSTDLAGATYVIFKDEYTLATDFARFLQNGSVYVVSGGRYIGVVPECPIWREFMDDYRSDPTDRFYKLMLNGRTLGGVHKVMGNPPPPSSRIYPYKYVRRIPPMTEYKSGTVAVEYDSPTVIGSDTYWMANVAAGDYFRINSTGRADSSKWYTIAAVVSNTELTLTEDYGEAIEDYQDYACSKAPVAYPYEFHEFILYDAVLSIVAESSDQNTEPILSKRNDILKDLKKNYKSRNTNIQVGVEDDGYR